MEKIFSDSEYSLLLQKFYLRYPSFQKQGSGAYSPGLEHISQMCAALGNPQDKFPTVHVAGTNGKGSTCNLLAAHYAAAGLKVGLYTSPHISDFRERMRVISNGSYTLISRQQVWDFLQKYGSEADRLDLSLFEVTTAMAFDFFAAEKVDIAIIETGLGGRLDATNIIKPRLSIVTNIGYDHMDILGHSLVEIAREKAGIIKEGVPAVLGEPSEEITPVFEEIAAQKGSPLTLCTQSGDVDDILKGMDLPGSYQRKNLCTVLCALKVLGEEPRKEALQNAARICGLHARWEKICDNPYTICDIGHNAHGLKYNFSQLEEMLQGGGFSSLVMVYGSVGDKDVQAAVDLLPKNAYIFFTQAEGPRAMDANKIAAMARRPSGSFEVLPVVADAVKAALERCNALSCNGEDTARPLLYIGGSTYVVAEALKFMNSL